MTDPSATASVEVAADPVTAFEIFTAEIDLWWVRNPINFFDSGRAVAMRIEPGVGGRVLEVYQDDVLELATITDWQPGTLLAYRSAVDDTETRISFDPVDAGTRVTVVQSLTRPDGKAFYFWPRIIRWLPGWTARRATAPRTPRDLGRLSIALYYEDPAAAAHWLHNVFAIDSWDTLPGEGDRAPWIDLNVGSSAIVLFPRPAGSTPPTRDHATWIYVDDLDAHFTHARSQGAKILTEPHHHGYRAYEAEDLEGHPWTFLQARPTQGG